MLKRQSRHLALLLVLTMLATMFVGVGVAQAKSSNGVNKVISVADGYVTKTGEASGIELTLKEDGDFINHFQNGDVFELILPDGVKWADVAYMDTNATKADIEKVSSKVVEVTMKGMDDAVKDAIIIPLSFEIDGATGTVAVTVEALDSAVTGGDYNFARVAEGDMTASVDSVKKISRNSSNKAGVIQLRETAVGSVYGDAKVVVKLPSNFNWIENDIDVSFSGGFSAVGSNYDVDVEGRDLIIEFTAPGSDQRGTIYITTYVNPSRSASLGEVEVGIKVDDENGEVFDGDLVIANYVDWGIATDVDEVNELVAGKFEQKTDTITITENVANTLLENRDLTVELPEWVKITEFKKVSDPTGFSIDDPEVTGEDNYVDIPIDSSSTSSAGKLKFKLTLSIEGNKSGDIEAKIYGAGVEETSLVIAKAVAPVIPSIDKVNEVKIGVQSQPLADLTIVEGKKNAVSNEYLEGPADFYNYADDNGRITLTLTEGAVFANTPTVTVTDGNLEISQANVRVVGDTQVDIPIKSEGTKLSTIKVSNINITLNRAIPEGDLKIRVGGTAVIENSRAAGADSATIEEGEFVTGSISVVAAKVVTPADPNAHAVSTFVIGNTVYQINGVDQAAMDQAPYLKNDRTYLPLRFVAYGLGIGDNGIIWDEVNRTVTLMKNDKVVQVKIGSTTMLVNGAAITMDTAPEITAAGRTCLPIRFVAEAFGAVVGWDAATQTVTVTL